MLERMMTLPFLHRPQSDAVAYLPPPLPILHRCPRRRHPNSRRFPLPVLICALVRRSWQHTCRGYDPGSTAPSRRRPLSWLQSNTNTLVSIRMMSTMQQEEAVAAAAAAASSGVSGDQLFQPRDRMTVLPPSSAETRRNLLSRHTPRQRSVATSRRLQQGQRPRARLPITGGWEDRRIDGGEDARIESNPVRQWLSCEEWRPTSLSCRKNDSMLLGALFSLTIVLLLASGYGADPEGVGTGAEATSTAMKALVASSEVVDDLERLTDNIIDATFPLTASDALSVAVGEGFAGVLGGLVSATLSSTMSSVLGSTFRSATSSFRTKQPDVDKTAMNRMKAFATTSSIGNEVVASGDFFLTRAAALPLLEATGLSSSLATVASVVLATVPYEIVKYTQRQQGLMKEEDVRLQQLLEKRKSEQQQWLNLIPRWTSPSSVDPSSLKPVLVDGETTLDFVEIFADVTKWLGYAVLVENYGGTLAWSGITGTFPYTENFIFGAVANLSSQVYSDLLYALFAFGGEEKQLAVTSRTLAEWSSLYLSSAITGATLFGVYEASQIPAKVLTSALFSGGVEGCFGSTDYNLCVESFLFNGLSPPGPSLEAQARAILTTLVSLWNRLGLDTPF